MNAEQARLDRAAYARAHPTWYQLRYHGPPSPEHVAAREAWTLMALAESRDEFYARILPRLGLTEAPTAKRKRAPSKIVQTLTARVAELERLLAARESAALAADARAWQRGQLGAPTGPVEQSPEVAAYAARVAELEAQVRGYERWGVAG